ncbi:peroxiredoxin [Acidithiobacillus sp.]|mgnify:CR=1 FL=1|uniref:peroxiredoxin n=1 Tax=Acidithiobacillus sp. TaxID=1872118 RepID=UPI0025C69458|nr:peroxiredoxin [Acidithiobacillus sp.]HUX18369.1 peroxiredoxin [Acidithiobacillus sp.]
MSSETITIGQPAPRFHAAAYGKASSISLDDLHGKVVVLYFYPKDNTPGCTTEGQEFTALYQEFQAAGAEILGVSRDTVASHEKFSCKFNFPFPLLADTDEALCKAFDVLKEKNNYGKVGIGVERSTFVIDREGKIAYIERKVKAAGHAAAMLQIVKQLP